MTLVRWTPARELTTLQDRINRFFNDSFSRAGYGDESVTLSTWHPMVDIYDDNDKIIIKAELPGIEKKDISIDLKDRVLTLMGERSADHEVNEDRYYRRERSYGKFERSFTLPAGLNPEKIKADHRDGVLKIEVPKPEEEKPKQITIH
jgi:HSP20 family protein